MSIEPQTGGYIAAPIMGRTRGLKFGNLAAENIVIKLAQLGIATGGNYSGTMIAVILYWGLFNNCIAKNQDVDFTFEEVLDWVDDVSTDPTQEITDTLTSVVRCYEESKAARVVLQGLEKMTEELKKKTAAIQASISTPPKAGNGLGA